MSKTKNFKKQKQPYYVYDDLPRHLVENIFNSMDSDTLIKFGIQSQFNVDEIDSFLHHWCKSPQIALMNRWLRSDPIITKFAEDLIAIDLMRNAMSLKPYITPSSWEILDLQMREKEKNIPDPHDTTFDHTNLPTLDHTNLSIFDHKSLSTSDDKNLSYTQKIGSSNQMENITSEHNINENNLNCRNMLHFLSHHGVQKYSQSETISSIDVKRRFPDGRYSRVFSKINLRGNIAALKMIELKNPEARDYFVREATGLIRFRDSKHVLKLIGFHLEYHLSNEDEPTAAYLMYPYIEYDLAYRISQSFSMMKLLSARERKLISDGVINGLQFIVNQSPCPGFHGNLMSQNILIDMYCHPYLANFGSSGVVPNDFPPDSYLSKDISMLGIVLFEIWYNEVINSREEHTSRLDQVEEIIAQDEKLEYEGMNSETQKQITKLIRDCIANSNSTRIDMVLTEISTLIVS